jgi:HAD superfamily hydrolase (TIGR01549 family)
MIKAITFDLYGTLARFTPGRYEIQSKAAAKFGLTLTEDNVLKGYFKADEFMSKQNANHPIRLMDANEKLKFFTEYERLILSETDPSIGLKISADVWIETQKTAYKLAVFNDVRPVLKTLKNQGFILAVITNMNTTGSEMLNKLKLSGDIDFAITSLEAKAEKPDQRIFEIAFNRIKCEPQQNIHVGDQVLSDIYGAKQIGTNYILIDRYCVNETFIDGPRITNLFQLPGVINKVYLS